MPILVPFLMSTSGPPAPPDPEDPAGNAPPGVPDSADGVDGSPAPEGARQARIPPGTEPRDVSSPPDPGPPEDTMPASGSEEPELEPLSAPEEPGFELHRDLPSDHPDGHAPDEPPPLPVPNVTPDVDALPSFDEAGPSTPEEDADAEADDLPGSEHVRAAAPTDPRPSAPENPLTPPSLKRVAWGFLAIVLVGLAALWYLGSLSNPDAGSDLVLQATRATENINSFVDEQDPESAERELFRRLGWRINVPRISDSPLKGIGFAEILPGITVPVLLYEDPSGGEIAVTIVDYAFLDTHEGVLNLEDTILKGVEQEDVYLIRKTRRQPVLVWRNGDEIFLAATPGNPESLAGRISSE